MLKQIAGFILICIFMGCSHTLPPSNYKDMIYDDDFAHERMSPAFLRQLNNKCPDMKADLEKLNAALRRAELSDEENTRIKTEGEIRWLTGWMKSADCPYEKPAVPVPDTEQKKTITNETVPSEVKIDNKTDQQNAERKSSPLSVMPLTFDECFMKCKDMTSRTNEECFDTCVGR